MTRHQAIAARQGRKPRNPSKGSIYQCNNGHNRAVHRSVLVDLLVPPQSVSRIQWLFDLSSRKKGQLELECEGMRWIEDVMVGFSNYCEYANYCYKNLPKHTFRLLPLQ